jgi:hypothetical protein
MVKLVLISAYKYSRSVAELGKVEASRGLEAGQQGALRDGFSRSYRKGV